MKRSSPKTTRSARAASSLRDSTVAMLRELRRQYLQSGELAALLDPVGITILDAFLENWLNIERFYAAYYGDGIPRTVLCGINPGRLGAGKTGIPFVDFSSLSKLLPNVTREGKERSAQFFYDIVSHFGAAEFFHSFYVTNVSWVGYAQNGKNVNYAKLPAEARQFIGRMFEYEMSVVAPERIIALSEEVQDTLSTLCHDHIDVSIRLPHPSYCRFPTNYDACRRKYIETLSRFIRS